MYKSLTYFMNFMVNYCIVEDPEFGNLNEHLTLPYNNYRNGNDKVTVVIFYGGLKNASWNCAYFHPFE